MANQVMTSGREIFNKWVTREDTTPLRYQEGKLVVEVIVYSAARSIHIYIEKDKLPIKSLDIRSRYHGDLETTVYWFRKNKEDVYPADTKLEDILEPEEFHAVWELLKGETE